MYTDDYSPILFHTQNVILKISAQNPNQAATVPTASPFINAANNQAGQSRPAPITANMLQQALQAAAQNMQATGQNVQSSLSGQNQNLQQAAQGVVGGKVSFIGLISQKI